MSPSAQRYRDHRACTQAPAQLPVNARIYFGVITLQNLSRGETGSGKSRVTVDTRPEVGMDFPRSRPQYNFVVFRQRNRQAIRASDRRCSVCNNLKHLIQTEPHSLEVRVDLSTIVRDRMNSQTCFSAYLLA